MAGALLRPPATRKGLPGDPKYLVDDPALVLAGETYGTRKTERLLIEALSHLGSQDGSSCVCRTAVQRLPQRSSLNACRRELLQQAPAVGPARPRVQEDRVEPEVAARPRGLAHA